jgi:hypothetical protein
METNRHSARVNERYTGPRVAGANSCEQGEEPSGFINMGNFVAD